MKSSKPLYGILGAYIPLSVLILWASFPGMIYRFILQTDSGFNEILWCLVGLLSALAASVYAGVIKEPGLSHRAADFRGGILAASLSYIFLSLIRRNTPFLLRFLPTVDSIAAAGAAVFIWFSVIFQREIYSGLELLDSFTAQYQGEQLREVVREFSPEISQTNLKLKSLIMRYGVQLVPPCLLLIAASFLNVPFTFAILVLFIFIAGFLILGYLGLLRRELLYATEGISLTVRDRSRPLPVMALGIGITSLAALILSTDSSLLPPGIILAIIIWIGRLLSSLFKPVDLSEIPVPGSTNMPMMENPMGELMAMEDEKGPWPYWDYVKYGFIALAVLLFLLFMIKPLLERRGFSIDLAQIRSAMARWFGDLKKGISAFFTAIFDPGASSRIRRLNEEKLKNISDLLSGGIKRKEIKRSVNLFARLILWGVETMDVPWKPSFAPGEYCALLAAKTEDSPEDAGPDTDRKMSEEIIRCGELF